MKKRFQVLLAFSLALVVLLIPLCLGEDMGVTRFFSAKENTLSAMKTSVENDVTDRHNGFLLTFNSTLSATSGNFWLQNSGHKTDLWFQDSAGYKNCTSLTFINYGTASISVTMRVLSSGWAERGSAAGTVAPGGKKTLEVADPNGVSTDFCYFYLSGLTATSQIGVIANYAAVDFSNITASSLTGTGESTFAVSLMEMRRITIPQTTGVNSFVAAYNGATLTPYRTINTLTEYVPVDTTLTLAGVNVANGYTLDHWSAGGTFTGFTGVTDIKITADTVFTPTLVLSAVSNGVYLLNKTVTGGNYWLDAVQSSLLYDNNSKVSLNLTNVQAAAISVKLAIADTTDWSTFQSVTVTVPAGSSANAELSFSGFNSAKHKLYLYLPAGALVGLWSNNSFPNYPTFASNTDFTVSPRSVGSAPTLTLPETQGVTYTVKLNGASLGTTCATYQKALPTGTAVTVTATPDGNHCLKNLLVGSTVVSTNGTYSIGSLTENTTVIPTLFGMDRAVCDGITLSFASSLSVTSGNFWLDQSFTYLDRAGTRWMTLKVTNPGTSTLSVTVASYPASASKSATVSPGTSTIMEISGIPTGATPYVYLSGLTVNAKVKLMACNAAANYAGRTAGALTGTGMGTFTVSSELTEGVMVTAGAAEGITYYLSVNGSSFGQGQSTIQTLVPKNDYVWVQAVGDSEHTGVWPGGTKSIGSAYTQWYTTDGLTSDVNAKVTSSLKSIQVQFVDLYQPLAVLHRETGDTVSAGQFPANPCRYCKDFAGWSFNGTTYTVKNALAAAVNNALAGASSGSTLTITAGFTASTTQCGISVLHGKAQVFINGAYMPISQAEPLPEGILYTVTMLQAIQVTADEEAGKTFSYWLKDGQICSYEPSYVFFASQSTSLTAVYDDPTLQSRAAVVTTAFVKNSDGSITVSTEHSASADCTFLSSGVVFGIFATEPDQAALLAATDTFRAVTKHSTSQNGTFNVTKRTAAFGNWYAISYITVNDTLEQTYTIYGNILSLAVT